MLQEKELILDENTKDNTKLAEIQAKIQRDSAQMQEGEERVLLKAAQAEVKMYSAMEDPVGLKRAIEKEAFLKQA